MLREEIILQWLLFCNGVISFLFVARHRGKPALMRLCVIEDCAGAACASAGVPCCSSFYSLKQSEDLPIGIKVPHEKPDRGFDGRAAAGRLLQCRCCCCCFSQGN